MPTLATGNKVTHSNYRGFTLVELLVAVAVMGLLSATVMLTLPSGGDRARVEAQRFLARVTTAAQDSILTGKPRGLAIDSQGYKFFWYREGQWQPADSRAELAAAEWDDDVIVTSHPSSNVGEEAVPAPPSVVFSPTGLVTPFSVDISGSGRRYTVTGSSTGGLAMVTHAETQP